MITPLVGMHLSPSPWVHSQEEWEEELKRVGQSLQRAVIELSHRRRAASARLGASVEGCLGELSMGRSRFDVGIAWRSAKEVIDFIPCNNIRQRTTLTPYYSSLLSS